MTLDRREFCSVSAVTLASLGVAGCLGDDGEDPDGEDGDEPDGEHTDRIAGFETAVEDRVGLVPDDVGVDDRTVLVEYESAHEMGTDGASLEMEIVGNSFGSRVNDGWDLDELEAELTDAEGDRYRWSIDAETAGGYMREEVPPGEYYEALEASVEPA